MNNIKRQLSVILSLIMVVGSFTMSAYALDDVSEAIDESQPVVAQEEPSVEAEAEPEEPAAEEEATVTEETAEEEPQVQDEEKEVVEAEEAQVVNNIVFSDATATSVKVAKGSDFSVAALTGIKFEAVADGTAVTADVSDGLEAAVEVTGLKTGTMYAVYAVNGDAAPVLLGYYVNTGLAAAKTYTTTTLTWAVDETADTTVELTKDGAAVEDVTGSEYVDSAVTGGESNVYVLTVKVTKGDAVYAAADETITVDVPVKPAQPAAPKLKGQKYKPAQYEGKGDSHVISPDQIKLSWNKITGATSYEVYKYDVATAKWVRIKTTTATTFTAKKLKNNHKYRFKVRAIKKTDYGTINGKYSSYVGTYTIKYLTVKPHAIYYNGVITATAKCFKTKSSKSVVTKVNTGTTCKVLQRAGGRSQILLSNGKVYWVNRSKCHYTKQIYNSKKDWTNLAKVNYAYGKSSSTKYLIWISQYTQRVNVYQGKKHNWKLIKTGLCATGKMERKTPMGTFKVGQKEKGWFYPGYKNAPVVHFAARNSFHSRPTYYNGKVKTKTIGKPASNGCCRLEQEYVDWIYKYVPKGTKVISW